MEVQDVKSLKRDSAFVSQAQDLYIRSFPDCERKPFEAILKGIESGAMEGWVLMEGERCIAIAFLILSESLVLLDYLAVDPQYQNQKIGTRLLDWVNRRYPQPVVIEIESTLEDLDPQKARRKQFYLSNKALLNPYEIELFGVVMEMLSLKAAVSYEEYETLMKEYFGEKICNRFVKFHNRKEEK